MLAKTFFLGLALAPLAVGAQWLLSKFIVGADPLTDISTNSVFLALASFPKHSAPRRGSTLSGALIPI